MKEGLQFHLNSNLKIMSHVNLIPFFLQLICYWFRVGGEGGGHTKYKQDLYTLFLGGSGGKCKRLKIQFKTYHAQLSII